MDTLPYLFDYISITELILSSVIILLIFLDFFRRKTSSKEVLSLLKEKKKYCDLSTLLLGDIKLLIKERSLLMNRAGELNNEIFQLHNKHNLETEKLKLEMETGRNVWVNSCKEYQAEIDKRDDAIVRYTNELSDMVNKYNEVFSAFTDLHNKSKSKTKAKKRSPK